MTEIDLEDFFERVRKGNELDSENLADEQRAITWGSTWVRWVRGYPVIFGYVSTLEELVSQETQYGATEEECEYLVGHRKSQERNDLLSCMCYSEVLIGGEQSTIHRAWVWPIDPVVFAEAMRLDWQEDRLPEPARLAVTNAHAAYQRHMRMVGHG